MQIMKSDSEIKYDFAQANAKADELEQVAKKLKRLAQSDLEESLQILANAWHGEAAEVYIGKGSRLKERILLNADKLDSTAKTIRSTAKRTYDAEMRAYRIAKEREYQNK